MHPLTIVYILLFTCSAHALPLAGGITLRSAMFFSSLTHFITDEIAVAQQDNSPTFPTVHVNSPQPLHNRMLFSEESGLSFLNEQRIRERNFEDGSDDQDDDQDNRSDTTEKIGGDPMRLFIFKDAPHRKRAGR